MESDGHIYFEAREHLKYLNEKKMKSVESKGYKRKCSCQL